MRLILANEILAISVFCTLELTQYVKKSLKVPGLSLSLLLLQFLMSVRWLGL